MLWSQLVKSLVIEQGTLNQILPTPRAGLGKGEEVTSHCVAHTNRPPIEKVI